MQIEEEKKSNMHIEADAVNRAAHVGVGRKGETYMTNINAVEYKHFLANPQHSGAWVLTIDLGERGLKDVQQLFNLDQFLFNRGSRYIDPESDDALANPPTIIPRLFAYLRHLLPKKTQSDLPTLLPREDGSDGEYRRVSARRFGHFRYLNEMAKEPRSLSADKKKKFAAAYSIYRTHFSRCRLYTQTRQTYGLDVISYDSGLYFHVVEESRGRIRLYSPQEKALDSMRRLFEALNLTDATFESVKLFSPESQLLALYIPSLRLVGPTNMFRDNSVLRAMSQSLLEAKEERFTHSIRAIGLGAEELIVEIFETFLHEKAPESPLGNLLADLNERIQDLTSGAKSKKSNVSSLKKQLGEAITKEKKKASPNDELCTLLQVMTQNVIPLLEQQTGALAEIEGNLPRQQRSVIFPAHINRCLTDLVQLRNRVSHRIDRLSAVRTVNYLEASLAIKSFATISLWWQSMKTSIDYNSSKKDVIRKAIEAAKSDGESA